MEEKIDELKKDLAELQLLESQATRSKVKDVLSFELNKLTSEVAKLQDQVNTQKCSSTSSQSCTGKKRYQIKLNNYAWDQNSKFIKFYVTLPKVQTIPQDNVTCNFTNRSLELNVKDLDNKDYVFTINKLLKSIDPQLSNWKIKTDMVLINAAKTDESNWSHVTQLEKKVSDSQKLKTDDNMDPNDGLMSLMKNMYERGDDEMKRTIAKAWSESQMKSNML